MGTAKHFLNTHKVVNRIGGLFGEMVISLAWEVKSLGLRVPE